MSGMERIRATLAAFGKRRGIDSAALDESGALVATIDDGMYVFQYNDVLDAFVIMACLGDVPQEARGMVFGQLLAANLLWGETGGCTFAYEPSEEFVVMLYSMPADKLDAEAFGEAFDSLRTISGEWRRRLCNWIEAELNGPTTL